MSTSTGALYISERATLLRAARSYFDEQGFIEVDTPVLAPALVPEPSIEIFATEVLGTLPAPLYLVPSPEVWMKRLLAAGSPRLYQIGHAFRNLEEQGSWHRAEFSILEWYDTTRSWRQAQDSTTGLLRRVAAQLRASGATTVAALDAEPLVMTMAALCSTAVGLPLVTQSAAELRDIAERLGVAWQAEDSWEVLFHRLFLAHVEQTIPTDRPVFVTDFPSRVPTLAKTTSGAATSQRWELYLGGVELANCYQEETNRDRLQAVYAAETARLVHSRTRRRTDWQLIDTFADAPDCSGVALGVDRLLALALGAESLVQVLPFG